MYHAVLGYAAASGQSVPRDHAVALKLAGKEVTRGLLPPPWDGWCEVCPQTSTVRFGGGSSYMTGTNLAVDGGLTAAYVTPE